MSDDTESRRQHPRYDATVRVRFADAEEFLACYTDSISKGGLFVATRNPLPPGTQVQLNLVLPLISDSIEILGVVAYQVDEDEDTAVRRPPGMGIRFEDLDPQTEAALDDYILFLSRKCRGRVLIVDDDTDYAGLLQEFLRQNDYSVVVVNNPQSGLVTLQHGEFNVIVVDLHMPRMDGLEFTDAVRELPHGSSIGVLLFTDSNLDDAQRRVAKQLGIQKLLDKPVQLEEFLGDIEQALVRAAEESNVRPEGVVPDRASANRSGSNGSNGGGEPREAKFDPRRESTLAKERREAQIANRYLRDLGVQTRTSADGTEVFGDLLLQHENLRGPFGMEMSVARIQLHAVGHDRFRIHQPEVFAPLDPIMFLDFRDRQSLERGIVQAIEAREEQCDLNMEWLVKYEVEARLEPDLFSARGRVEISGRAIVFSVVVPGTLMVDSVDGHSVSAVLDRHERSVDVGDAETALELEMNLEPVARQAWEALAKRTSESGRSRKPDAVS